MAKKKKEAEDAEDTSGLSPVELREKKIAEMVQATLKKFGKRAIYKGSEFDVHEVARIPSGILPLDYGLGGGWPVGRISLSYGKKSSSKTTNFLRTVGIAQKMCSKCWTFICQREGQSLPNCKCGEGRRAVIGWNDVEGVWDEQWSKKFLKVEDIILTQPATAEQTIDTSDSMVRSGEFDIIVIDSLAFMTPQGEINRAANEETVGTQARLNGRMIRKFVSGINMVAQTEGRRPTVFLTNQIRMKVGVMFGNPETQPGGMACGFATSVEVRCSSGKVLVDEEVTLKPLSAEMKFKIDKNKTAATQGMEVEYKIVLSKTEIKQVGDVIDEEWSIDMAEKCGIVDKDGVMYTWHDQKFHGKSGIGKFFAKERNAYAEFRDELLPVLLAV